MQFFVNTDGTRSYFYIMKFVILQIDEHTPTDIMFKKLDL